MSWSPRPTSAPLFKARAGKSCPLCFELKRCQGNSVNILLFASAYNGLCQRVHCELTASGHHVSIELSADETQMHHAVQRFAPELIVCPFLKHRVPESLWRDYPCLIVHPGIEGDRGPSSLDWAITLARPYWGVTLLQADAEMDAGDIWGTREFERREAPKASLYRREVTAAAVQLVREAIAQRRDPDFRPRPLDDSAPEVKGCWQPVMAQAERAINWCEDTCAGIVRKINAADSFPGVRTDIDGDLVYLFGASLEYRPAPGVRPGQLVGHRDDAVCLAAKDGVIWVRQMKMAPQQGQTFFKLPALQVVREQFAHPERYADLPALSSDVLNDIGVRIRNGVAYLSFNFYNGAMNAGQCRRLQYQLRELGQRRDIRVIALLGGEDFWSNGIHLNCIEAAADPARESWVNINAIDDLVREILTLDDKITVAALRCNAGAGGAIIPLACDRVLAREGVVLNPHYQTMGLYGSEYWTYLLPRRVGDTQARALTRNCLPVVASSALELGLVDLVLPEDWHTYHTQLERECEQMARERGFDDFIHSKRRQRILDESVQPLESYRAQELSEMKAVFDDPESDYHRLRYNFVHKVSCGQTPARLVQHRDLVSGKVSV